MKSLKINRAQGKIYFMSDLHLNHANVFKHCPGTRPFESLEDMTEKILAELKNKIQPEDTVFDLGDLFWKADNELMNKTMEAIGTKNLYKILGNHDKDTLYYPGGCLSKNFLGVYDRTSIWIKDEDGKDYNFVLDHFPLDDWDRRFHGSWMLHGHCHGHWDAKNLSDPELGGKRIDVGFDADIAQRTGSFLVEFKDIISYGQH